MVPLFIGAAIGGVVGGAVSAYGAYKTAKMQQRFAERMANTAHQREVSDLRAAGLNPILSATGGGGAPSPDPNIPDLGRGAGQAISSAMQFSNQKKQTDAMVGKTNAERLRTLEETKGIKFDNFLKGEANKILPEVATSAKDLLTMKTGFEGVIPATGRTLAEHRSFTSAWNAKKELRKMHFGIDPFVIERKGRLTPAQLEKKHGAYIDKLIQRTPTTYKGKAPDFKVGQSTKGWNVSPVFHHGKLIGYRKISKRTTKGN